MNRIITITAFVLGLLTGNGTVAFSQEDVASSGFDVATVQEFDQLDRDRDGKLSEREFAFTEIAERLYEGGKRKMVSQVFSMINTNSDEGISLPELVQSPQNRNARLLDRKMNRSFILSDTNQDGIIALDEYSTRPKANLDLFGRIDLNDNDKIGPFEWIHELKSSKMENSSAEVFAKLDQNDDGAISAEEFQKGDPPEDLKNAFEAIDLNGNREIGPGEYAKAISLPAGHIGISPNLIKAFEEVDRNKDHSLSFREFERAIEKRQGGPYIPPPPPPFKRRDALEHIFHKFDFDRDKEISISELADAYHHRGMKGGPGGKGKGKGKGKGPK